MEKTVNVTSGFSLSSLGFILFLVFLVLKLVGVIDWSWFYVTLPLWIPIVFYILLVAIILIVIIIINKVDERKMRK